MSAPEPDAIDNLIEPENPLPPITRSDLSQVQKDAANRAGWNELMPVQAHTIPYILERRDLMIQSRTGSGKTGAFILPILDLMNVELNQTQALILVPTRELARQVAGEAAMLAGDSGIRTIAVYGGVGYGAQLDAFKQGAHIVVGTPGRVLDHLLRGSLTLDALLFLIFDEADRMLSMGFYPDMKRVQGYLPRKRINGYMFSATFPEYVLGLARQFLHKPGYLSLSRDHVHVTDTDHVYYVAPAMEKDRALVRIIEIENPNSAIIFCNTRAQVDYVTTVLQRFGYDADKLTADLSQNARERVLGRVRERSLRFLVATDLAARGIDISDLSHVVQYEPPEDPEAYIHRAGRTGRAGARGEAISLVDAHQEMELQRIARRYDIEMQERMLPSDADVASIVGQRVTALLEARLRDRDKLKKERMQRFIPLVRELGESADETKLVAMLLDDFYQESLHAAPPQPEVNEPVKKNDGKADYKRNRPRHTSRRRN